MWAFAATWYGYGYGYWYGYSNGGWTPAGGGTYYQLPFYTGASQLQLTNYGLVSSTTYTTWNVIKLIDLKSYLDRSNPKQDAFGNIRKLQSKWVKAMPTVGADLADTDAIYSAADLADSSK